MTSQIAPRASRRRLILGTGLVLGVGAAAMVLFILPAETGVDVTGSGKASGLSAMANPAASTELKRGLNHPQAYVATNGVPSTEPGASDHFTYELLPYEEIELKYVLDENAPIAFSWTADGPLNYDFHAHPFAGGEALTESYAVAKDDRQAGRYTAAFSGIHGWHWQNRTLSTVHITLDTSGQIKGSKLFGSQGAQDRQILSP